MNRGLGLVAVGLNRPRDSRATRAVRVTAARGTPGPRRRHKQAGADGTV